MPNHRARVLLVDDDVTLRAAIARMLTPSFRVEQASDGAEMIERVQNGDTWDYILMDLEMPRMDGRLALTRLTEIAPLLARRTIIMTGGSSVVELQRWIEGLGPGRLLLKPFSKRLLEETIEDLVG